MTNDQLKTIFTETNMMYPNQSCCRYNIITDTAKYIFMGDNLNDVDYEVGLLSYHPFSDCLTYVSIDSIESISATFIESESRKVLIHDPKAHSISNI